MSARGLNLRAYLALTRGGTAPAGGLPPRPEGPLIWVHADNDEQGRALARLCGRLCLQRPEIAVMATGAVPDQPCLIRHPLPEDRPAAAEAFAAALRPDCALWAGQTLRPALIDAMARQGTHLTLLGATDAPWTSPAARWMPDPAAATLALFDRVHATDGDAMRALRRIGIEPERLRLSGILRDGGLPLDCDMAQHGKLAAHLAGRPLWLAAHLRAAEADLVLRAHRHALRLAHRLLLVTVPHNEDDTATIARAAADSGLRICHWDAGELPDENTQVMLVDGPEELGLWYRLAPLAFIGGSLAPGHGGQDPFEAAALGCALLYGPNVGQHLTAYTQLVEAGAARIVRDADSLAAAVSHLVAPDKAAAMAHAGWRVISEGAALVDTVIAEVLDQLDLRAKASA
ncbi:3-deoxy-D-manno-octulosonic acid transferase [Citreimonas salinaria]|uniref:3-deoxy-D-manno-octulosonic acid transferase n=1 Tax=Citreimonas salinaria TaxID=321339 RepID=A0A1H3MB25_9RHOB|nr:glycosyltransferase N-terminal domain-containing protein [Citreimonas salinaria]SDY73205.1 3-deoxy-D-manno-octulosonic-acid transferase [Citreimonas salinaria]